MSYRVGTKIGKMWVSLGRGGTYVSTLIGGFRVSKFTPKGRASQDNVMVSVFVILAVLGFLMLIS